MSDLYEVEVVQERSLTLYVIAEDREAAIEDAREIAASTPGRAWEHEYQDTWPRLIEDVDGNVRVWSGGPDGRYLTPAQAREVLRGEGAS